MLLFIGEHGLIAGMTGKQKPPGYAVYLISRKEEKRI
jgi:hypothetical protein